jgi:hypothetical protein
MTADLSGLDTLIETAQGASPGSYTWHQRTRWIDGLAASEDADFIYAATPQLVVALAEAAKALENMWDQFSYDGDTGGLSALEHADAALAAVADALKGDSDEPDFLADPDA